AILDRTGGLLATSAPVSGTYLRLYPLPDAAPVVGYYSLNYGVAGVEAALDAVLRGPLEPIDQLLHRRPAGRTVRTTIDPDAQRDLAARLTQSGAAIILSLPDGAVLALESHPTYDPNTLDQDWPQLAVDPGAPLLNRVTQGLYQPGAIFQTILLADAIERGAAALTQTVDRPDQPVALDNLILDCARTGSMATLADAYANACPAPFADLGVRLGDTELISLTQRWQLDQPPAMELRTSAIATPTTSFSTTQALQAFAVGQSSLTLSPLQVALIAATIGNRGVRPAPHVISDVQSIGGVWTPYTNMVVGGQRLISPNTARSILRAMRSVDDIAGHGGAAFSGDKQLSWFFGLMPADEPRYVIVVLIETPQGRAATEAEDIGRAALKALQSR
ncbi:MAG TPA: penicillin-binding transpeptidase domain-containing protein, partial [Anaerolineae bacterium]|nr:penicillin-binding transpeptidase domain-containing protein [Anaerolineae bacterium]